jgi:hypothetical protein
LTPNHSAHHQFACSETTDRMEPGLGKHGLSPAPQERARVEFPSGGDRIRIDCSAPFAGDDAKRARQRGFRDSLLPPSRQLANEHRRAHSQRDPEYQVSQRLDSGPGSFLDILHSRNDAEVRILPFGSRARRGTHDAFLRLVLLDRQRLHSIEIEPGLDADYRLASHLRSHWVHFDGYRQGQGPGPLLADS